MIALSVAEVAAALGAELVGPAGPADAGASVTAVTADSRTVGPGTLFVALPGERVDGHAFVPGAYAAGAVAALVAQPTGAGPEIVVADPLLALGRLARHVVDRRAAEPLATRLRVVGITGSQGKTSTKDLLAHVLATAGPTVAPVGNLNNELGVPLTVARVDGATRFLVAEMGARGIGHIAYLCEIAPPEVGVVLNVGHAHVGEFGGRDAIAVAKGELVEAVGPGGVAVLNADDPLVWAMRSRTVARVVGFGVEAEPPAGDAVWAEELVGDARGRYGFALHARLDGSPDAHARVQLLGTGRHQVGNAVAAAAAALVLGVDLDAVAAALGSAGPASRWRMEVGDRADGVTVLNDAYNANPDSMRAAVATLADLGSRREGRTWAVLGDMLELGDEAPAAHAELGREVAAAGVDELVVLGAYAGTVVAAAHGLRARVAGTKEQAVTWVTDGVAPGDVVLVKASRGLALDTVAAAVLAAGTRPEREDDPA